MEHEDSKRYSTYNLEIQKWLYIPNIILIDYTYSQTILHKLNQ